MRRQEWTVVSLFTGAGGLDIGLETAGFRCVAATDAAPDCIATLKHNQAARILVPGSGGRRFLDGTKIVLADAAELDPRVLRPAASPRSWRPDLLTGGPPCQPFSSSGKQLALEDPRGRLFEHFVRIASALRPRFILFENVRGLVTARGPHGAPGEALSLVRRAFEQIGYATKFALLNAADFGVPQRRVRLVMLGTLDGPVPEFPEPTHGERVAHALFGPTLPWVTLAEFLASQPPPDEIDVVRPSAALAAGLRGVPDGCGLRSAGAREETRPGGHWGYRQGTFVADPRRPARTVTASVSQDWVRIDGGLRRLTERECAGLQGFPSAWTFVGTRSGRMRQVGNAVPARLAEVVGARIVDALQRPVPRTKPVSEPFPAEFTEAVAYTRREQERNGRSRSTARAMQASGRSDVSLIKGLGSWETRPSRARVRQSDPA